MKVLLLIAKIDDVKKVVDKRGKRWLGGVLRDSVRAFPCPNSSCSTTNTITTLYHCIDHSIYFTQYRDTLAP